MYSIIDLKLFNSFIDRSEARCLKNDRIYAK